MQSPFKLPSMPTTAEVQCYYVYVRAVLLGMLWAMRSLADFLLGHFNGAPPGEAATYLNVRIGNRERAVKASVGALFENNVSEALKGFSPFGARKLLSNAAGEVAGNLAALASSDDELARGVGEALAAAFSGSALDDEPNGHHGANGAPAPVNGDGGASRANGHGAPSPPPQHARTAQCHASVVFVRGPLCVLRVRVSVSSEGVASLLSLTAGPTAADWWRFVVHELLPSVCVVGPACARLLDAAARTCVATLLCRQNARAVPAAVTESLKGEVRALAAWPRPTCHVPLELNPRALAPMLRP